MKFSLVYEMANREFNNILLLKTELERRGHKVKIYNKSQNLRFFGTKTVALLPNSYCASDLDAYRYKLNLRNNPIVIYPCEQLINHEVPSIWDYSDKNSVKDITTLCWGKDYYEFMKSLGVNSEKMKITGAIQLDYCRPQFSSIYESREEIAKKFNLPVDKKWLLFISDFCYVDNQTVELYIKENVWSECELRKRQDYETRMQKEILEWFDKLVNEHDDYVVIYRKHPVEVKSECLEECVNKNQGKIFEISELNIKQWFFVADKLANYNSTSVVEAAIAGKDTILTRPAEFPEGAHVSEYKFFQDYPRASGYSSFIKQLYSDNKNITKILGSIKEDYDIQDRPSFMRVADVLEDIGRESELKPLEKGYTLARVRFLLSNHIYSKYFVKALYRFLYRLTGIKPKKETVLAIKEWFILVDNGRIQKHMQKKLLKILKENY